PRVGLMGDWPAGTAIGSLLLDDDVDEAARHIEHPQDLAAFGVRADTRAGQRHLPRLLLPDVDRHVEAVPQLAVDLDHERERLRSGQRLVVSGPALLVDAVGPAAAGPELLGHVGSARGR